MNVLIFRFVVIAIFVAALGLVFFTPPNVSRWHAISFMAIGTAYLLAVNAAWWRDYKSEGVSD
jgi:hypothetical protein